jgi:quercetin dioxygenase-like cupin family protein
LEQQSAPIGQQSDLSLVNQGTEPVTLYAVSLEPAPDATDSANSASVTERSLLDVVLPEEQLQTPGRFNSIMGYYSIPAGSQDSWSGPTDTAPEPLVWHVLSGTYAVRADQDVQVTRAGASGKTSVVAAGTESTLGPGDTLVRPAGALMELANDGTEPVLLVVWTLGDINVQGPSLPSSWDSLPCYPGETSGTAPSGPVRLKLRLVTVTPGSTFSAPAGAFVQQFLDLTSEAPNLGQKSDYSLINQGTEPVTLYVVSLEPASPVEATPVSST